ncbi:MAG: 3-methylitaconate isomerase, partial [Chloroflexi bacterium]|nr:3-methylitaconate isomerase [Chloroflexota bacterium]
DYTFAQIGIVEPTVDWKANCGNLSAAVGAFAVDEGLVRPVEPTTPVVAFNTNTQKKIYVDVPVRGGRAAVTGDTRIDGVAGTGAPLLVDFRDSAGTATGSLLPTGRARDTFALDDRPVEGSIVDVANPSVFVRASDFGLAGTELPAQITGDAALLDRLQAIRGQAAVRLGFVDDWREARLKSPSVPFVILVSPPADYVAADGREVRAGDVDLVGRPISAAGFAHKSFQGTGSVCTAVAALIPGTIVAEAARLRNPGRVVLGHGLGTLELAAAVEPHGDAYRVTRAALVRTARRLFDGAVYVPRAAMA